MRGHRQLIKNVEDRPTDWEDLRVTVEVPTIPSSRQSLLPSYHRVSTPVLSVVDATTGVSSYCSYLLPIFRRLVIARRAL